MKDKHFGQLWPNKVGNNLAFVFYSHASAQSIQLIVLWLANTDKQNCWAQQDANHVSHASSKPNFLTFQLTTGRRKSALCETHILVVLQENLEVSVFA